MSSQQHDTYFVRRQRKIVGPYSVSQIETAIRKGQIKESDDFSERYGGPWSSLKSFYLNAEITPYAVKRPFYSMRSRVSYCCPRCEERLWNDLTEAGSEDSCPHCGIGFRVPGNKELTESKRASAERRESKKQAQQEKAGNNPWEEEKIRVTDPRIVFKILGDGVWGWIGAIVAFPLLLPLFIVHLLVESIVETVLLILGDIIDLENGVVVPVLGGLIVFGVLAVPIAIVFWFYTAFATLVIAVLAGSPILLILVFLLFSASKSGAPSTSENAGSVECPYCGHQIAKHVKYRGQLMTCQNCSSQCTSPKKK